jgi:hypothetical protein
MYWMVITTVSILKVGGGLNEINHSNILALNDTLFLDCTINCLKEYQRTGCI